MGTKDDEILESLKTVDRKLDWIHQTIINEKTSSQSLEIIFGILCTILAEFPPYRFETNVEIGTKKPLKQLLITNFERRKEIAASLLVELFKSPRFLFLRNEIHIFEKLILSTLEPKRFMPFRVIQVGKIADRFFDYSLCFDADDNDFLNQIHALKYPRFGTSGWRARWGIDCDERTAKCVAQAISDFVLSNNVPEFVAQAVPDGAGRTGKVLLIGYDSRANARRVAEWVAQIASENNITVNFAKRDTPTPALIFHALEVIGENNVAGIVNCTASHNPPEWQGIKFSPYNGVPAPTAITDFVAARANQLKLRGTKFPKTPRGYALRLSDNQKFDPKKSYCNWLLSSKRSGIPLNSTAIKRYYNGKTIVIDEMHGTSRGYFRTLMNQLGVRYKVIHGEKSHKDLEKLGYASPEWPYIAPLSDAVKRYDASLGVGFDTDADRFGIIDENGMYIKPNCILPLLIDHLLRHGIQGKIVRTVPGSRLIDRITAANNIAKEYKPNNSITPSYIQHAFYTKTYGEENNFRGLSVFLEPVGIKYVIEGMLIDEYYKVSYRPNFRNSLLLGGEESSGLTTKGHLPDKDGIWGNLLVMNMIATENAPLAVLWEALCSKYGLSLFERIDIDAGDQAKERLITHLLEYKAQNLFAGFSIKFIGGVIYDVVEMQLRSESPEAEIFLEVRASGTEPINRIYTEVIMPPSKKEHDAKPILIKVQTEVLNLLEKFSIDEIQSSRTPQELSSLLAVTNPDRTKIREAVDHMFLSESMKAETLKCLSQKIEYLERRNRNTACEWLNIYS
jgi:phosphomannomutase